MFALIWKRIFAGIIKLRILNEIILIIWVYPKFNNTSLIQRDKEKTQTDKASVKMEAEMKEMQPEANNKSGAIRAGRDKEACFSYSLPTECGLLPSQLLTWPVKCDRKFCCYTSPHLG